MTLKHQEVEEPQIDSGFNWCGVEIAIAVFPFEWPWTWIYRVTQAENMMAWLAST